MAASPDREIMKRKNNIEREGGGTAVNVRFKCLMKPVAAKKPCTKHIETMKARLTASVPAKRLLNYNKRWHSLLLMH